MMTMMMIPGITVIDMMRMLMTIDDDDDNGNASDEHDIWDYND